MKFDETITPQHDPKGAEFLALRIAADKAEIALREAVIKACPKPHRVIRPRDGLPPWCPACGRDNDGFMWKSPHPRPQPRGRRRR